MIFYLFFIVPIWEKISVEAKDFLANLLCYKPENRLCAMEALNDPWIIKYRNAKEIQEEDLAMSLEKIRCFRTQMTFQKAVLAYMASHQLSKAEEKKLREIFESLDADRNGSLSKEELIKGYMHIYKDEDKSKYDVERVMKKLDINQNGCIDYNGIYNSLLYRIFNG